MEKFKAISLPDISAATMQWPILRVKTIYQPQELF